MSVASNSTCPVCKTAEIVCGKWTLLLIRDLAAANRNVVVVLETGNPITMRMGLLGKVCADTAQVRHQSDKARRAFRVFMCGRAGGIGR